MKWSSQNYIIDVQYFVNNLKSQNNVQIIQAQKKKDRTRLNIGGR